ncbi:hypothetical protein [Lysinibacter sp. HNR]|uniref:hypothetical protein n=1 Tax=Lysinibacter sp. HNR TaxID=3031408 RepID=UPI0024359BEA|nr:hypothetical protein [Lysinibacter sp. HNR]WGD37928.1 hypothetical protein FrondiHNR_03160 [Lysinibacter sp. HNR]
MSRQRRTGRGLVGAVFITLVAAVSHLVAGGNAPSPLGLAGSLIIAITLCILCAGTTLSLWRTTVAVCTSQALFHLFFSYVTEPSRAGEQTRGPHDHSLSPVSIALADGTVNTTTDAHGTWMWVAHAGAATATILLLRRGEYAVEQLIRLTRLLTRFPSPSVPRLIILPRRAGISLGQHNLFATARRWFTTLRYRGPPLTLAQEHNHAAAQTVSTLTAVQAP